MPEMKRINGSLTQRHDARNLWIVRGQTKPQAPCDLRGRIQSIFSASEWVSESFPLCAMTLPSPWSPAFWYALRSMAFVPPLQILIYHCSIRCSVIPVHGKLFMIYIRQVWNRLTHRCLGGSPPNTQPVLTLLLISCQNGFSSCTAARQFLSIRLCRIVNWPPCPVDSWGSVLCSFSVLEITEGQIFMTRTKHWRHIRFCCSYMIPDPF